MKNSSWPGKVRIIGGQWRGRKLTVLDHPGLRPTPDRLRETLFNWLTYDLPDRCCLDLFAGTGALGIEAASRGAKEVWLVEHQPTLVGALRAQVTQLSAHQVKVIQADAGQFLKGTAAIFDIVFLDPPFEQNLLAPSCFLLEQYHWLNSPAYIYLEAELQLGQPTLPSTWQIIRQSKAGQVVGWLAVR